MHSPSNNIEQYHNAGTIFHNYHMCQIGSFRYAILLYTSYMYLILQNKTGTRLRSCDYNVQIGMHKHIIIPTML